MDNAEQLTYTQGVSAQVPATDPNELRPMVVRLARLVEISVTLNSTLEFQRLLEFIIRTAADLLECEAASILLVDERTHDLFFAAATGSDPAELAKISVPMEGSIAGAIFREDRPIIVHDASQDARLYRKVSEKIRFTTRSLLGVPMRIRERVTGVLEAVNKTRGAFDDTDVHTLSIIASQAAVAIHNARLVDALQQANEELGKLDRLKSDFIAIASHELRTPLGVVLGYASILKEGAEDETSEYAQVVLNSAVRMRLLIEDMTNLTMLRIGEGALEMERQPLAPIVQQAFDEVSGLIQAKGQSLMLGLPEENLEAVIDAEKMRQSLTNLLNNAIRFTPTSGRIWLTLERHGAEAWLRVGDNGIGIPRDQLEAVFGQFYQVESHLTRKHEGMGLGLAIVKAVAEAHGGRVWAESDGLGLGAMFSIALPLAS